MALAITSIRNTLIHFNQQYFMDFHQIFIPTDNRSHTFISVKYTHLPPINNPLISSGPQIALGIVKAFETYKIYIQVLTFAGEKITPLHRSVFLCAFIIFFFNWQSIIVSHSQPQVLDDDSEMSELCNLHIDVFAVLCKHRSPQRHDKNMSALSAKL